MFNIFKTKDEKLFQGLKQDGIAVTQHEIQKARENDPEALYKIGDIYYKKKEYKKAFAWFHKAALQDYSDAQAQVGFMYRWAQGVSQDYKQAMDWFMEAASAGNANGQYNIGKLYYWGRGVSVDHEQAMHWYLKAANNGNTKAMKEIGYMYKYSFGVTANIHTTIEWYTKAANQGDADAQYRLGDIYQREDEVKDLQKAVNWYQKAADNNFAGAKEVKILNEQGYYAKEDIQEEEETDDEDEDATTNIIHDQGQPSITTSNNDEHFNKLMQSRMDNLEKMLQSKVTLMEGNNDTLQNELAALRQEKHQQNEENKRLRDELAKQKVVTEDNINNDLNYDSSDNDGDDENTTTANVSVVQGSNDALLEELATLKQIKLDQHAENQHLKERLARMEAEMQINADNDLNYDSSDNENHDSSATNNVDVKKKDDYVLQEERAALKQKELEQHEENQLLIERLARIVAGVQDDPHNDHYYNSSDNRDDDKNDNTHNTKCCNGEKKEDGNNTTTNTQQRESHYHSVEIYADPNYDSSDNEDPRNDTYLD